MVVKMNKSVINKINDKKDDLLYDINDILIQLADLKGILRQLNFDDLYDLVYLHGVFDAVDELVIGVKEYIKANFYEQKHLWERRQLK